MGAILNEIVPKASAGGTGGVSNRNPNWHCPSYYGSNGMQAPGGARGSQPSAGQRTQDFFSGFANPFGMDQNTMNTMNQFGQRMDREGMNPAQGLGVQPGQGNAFNPLQGLFGGQQGGQGGFNPFSFLGGL